VLVRHVYTTITHSGPHLSNCIELNRKMLSIPVHSIHISVNLSLISVSLSYHRRIQIQTDYILYYTTSLCCTPIYNMMCTNCQMLLNHVWNNRLREIRKEKEGKVEQRLCKKKTYNNLVLRYNAICTAYF